MSVGLHWLDFELHTACGGYGRGTIQWDRVTCEACKATESYLAAAGKERPKAGRG